MSTERDTHFEGSATRVARELYENGLLDLNHAAVYDAPGKVVQIITNYAYDIALHTLTSITASKRAEYGDPDDCLEHVPDLPQLPDS